MIIVMTIAVIVMTIAVIVMTIAAIYAVTPPLPRGRVCHEVTSVKEACEKRPVVRVFFFR
jgi:hypothetical protein